MKKILLLGGSAQQVVAVQKAKALGYFTVLCDYLPDNPGQYEADRFYLVSTTDKDAVLAVAQKEKVDGVLAYASDPAAPTAAYVAEKLHLPSNPYTAVETLCNKTAFRTFLRENDFSCPNAVTLRQADEEKAEKALCHLHYPIIVKPVDSSGSKGATVIQSPQEAKKAVRNALRYSRSQCVIAEEYIEKNHRYLIGGDLFVSNGEIILWGLMNCHRDQQANSLVPVGKSYPLLLEDDQIEQVQKVLRRLVSAIGFQNGEMNVELIIDQYNRVFPVDIGPRAGGNMIPDLLSDIFGIDLVTMSLQAVMEKQLAFPLCLPCPASYYATYNLHSTRDGVFKEILFSESIEKYIYKKCIYKKRGDAVSNFENASAALGIIFLKFPSLQVMTNIMAHIDHEISPLLEEGN